MMTPAFSSWQDFFAMGGYAFYVWLAVFFTLVSLAGLVCHTFWHYRYLQKQIVQRQIREQRIQAARRKRQTDQSAGGME